MKYVHIALESSVVNVIKVDGEQNSEIILGKKEYLCASVNT